MASNLHREISNDRLDGWKAIADYLGKTIRTVQRWEKERKLPIHRIPTPQNGSGTKDSIYAWPAELDDWLQQGGPEGQAAGTKEAFGGGPETGSVPQDVDPASAPNRVTRITISIKSPVAIAVGLACLLALVGAGWFWSYGKAITNPKAAVVLVANTLVVSGTNGPLWSKQWPRSFSGELAGHRLHLPVVVDLDGDSRNEVVFGYKLRESLSQERDRVICFDSNGALRWEYVPGAQINWNGFQLRGSFTLWDFSSEGLQPDGRRFTVVIGNHFSSPSHVAILDPRGERLGEYWHTGYIFDHDLLDVDNDGISEIALGGINNEFRRPALALIRYNIQEAISPVPSGFAAGLTSDKELVYRLLPRSDVADVLAMDERVKVVFHADDTLRVELEIHGHPDVRSRVYFLDRHLRPLRLELTQDYLALHKRLQREGKLDHEVTETEKKKLLELERVTPEMIGSSLGQMGVSPQNIPRK